MLEILSLLFEQVWTTGRVICLLSHLYTFLFIHHPISVTYKRNKKRTSTRYLNRWTHQATHFIAETSYLLWLFNDFLVQFLWTTQTWFRQNIFFPMNIFFHWRWTFTHRYRKPFFFWAFLSIVSMILYIMYVIIKTRYARKCEIDWQSC